MDEELPPPNIDQSGHTTSRKSARGARVEVITRGERRRSWTAEQKCQIVAESLGPELSPAEVARKYAIGSGQLYTWRRQLLSVQPGAVMTRVAPRFAQVELASPPLPPAPDVPADHQPPASSPPLSQSRPGGRMEITLPGGVTLRVDADVDGAALRRVLAVLDMRRAFHHFYVSTKSPIAADLLARVASLYAIEAEIRCHPAEHRRQVRQDRSRPIVAALPAWLQAQLPRLPHASDLAKAMRYALKHWPGLVAFLDDCRIGMDTNVVERAICPNTLNRKNALFAGSDGGARHWAIKMTLIQTAKLNDVDPMAWLTDVLERVVSGRTRSHEMASLLPWNWQPATAAAAAERAAA